MYGPHVAILLMCVSRNTRHVDFHGLTGSQRTPRVWGVTDHPSEDEKRYSSKAASPWPSGNSSRIEP